MELRHLRYFIAVAEALNFSRAAAQLHVTQPALSRQIRDLELELGCRLLLRGANARTELTPEGRRLLVGAKGVLAAAESLVSELKGRSNVVRFGHYGALWLDHFSPVLRQFSKRHKGLVLQPVEMTPRELVGALRNGEIDLGLVGLVDEAMRREFQTRQVAAYPTLLALSATHPLAKRRRLRLDELRHNSWATWNPHDFPGRKQLLVDACGRAGFKPRIVFETDSMASLLMRVATSDVVGHVISLSKKMPHQGIVFAQVDPPTAFMSELHAAWRRNDPRGEMIGKLVEQLASHPTS
ncbi:MAG: LysR family transcriptional regulator [Opitutus sp.]